MAVAVVMPRLGWTMETGSVLAWHKQEGEAVEAGEILFTVQSDKAATEVEALEDGILHIPASAPPVGAEVPIGTVLAYLLSPGEAPPAGTPAAPADGAAAPPEPPSPTPAAAGATPELIAGGAPADGGRTAPDRPPASPRARRVAAALGIDWQTLRGSGSGGRILERDVRAAAPAPGAAPRVPVTPPARRPAPGAGIDVQSRAATEAGTGRRPTQTDTVAGVRRAIAQRLAESARATVPVTLTTEADATALARLRAALKADAGHRPGERQRGDERGEQQGAGSADERAPVPSYTDLLAKVVALALGEHPDLNASWTDDGVLRHEEVHVGIAVDTGRGLLVPVVRDVARKPVATIARESARLIARARAGQCTPHELRGGTFTITNLGMYDVDAFTPVINLPECAVLGVGRVVARPVVVDEAAERVAVRKMLALSLTFDHRIVDGAPAARFLQRVKRLVEHPYLWLTR
jgi:pyruvate dehydrogenase E2 component (dihydrolipoamide acetyltransferase)